MELNTVQTELRIRRLGWMENMLWYPGHNVQVRAALAGVLEVRGEKFEGHYEPWLIQLGEDVEWLLKRMIALREGGRASAMAADLWRWREEGELWRLVDPRSMQSWYGMGVVPRQWVEVGEPEPVYDGRLGARDAGEVQ